MAEGAGGGAPGSAQAGGDLSLNERNKSQNADILRCRNKFKPDGYGSKTHNADSEMVMVDLAFWDDLFE